MAITSDQEVQGLFISVSQSDRQRQARTSPVTFPRGGNPTSLPRVGSGWRKWQEVGIIYADYAGTRQTWCSGHAQEAGGNLLGSTPTAGSAESPRLPKIRAQERGVMHVTPGADDIASQAGHQLRQKKE